jgi:CRISPR system Cascade subunit CasC
MLVETHIIQNFAPSNLNRDDTGSPKDCEFGGYRRARISSQCLKRAVREAFRKGKLLPEERLARRTKRLVDGLTKRLVAAGKDSDAASGVVEAALAGVGFKVDEKTNKTQYLLYLGEDEIDRIGLVCASNWDALAAVNPQRAGGNEQPARGGARDAKQAGRQAVPKEVSDAIRAILDGGRAADLALFGRMLADLPEHNIDAACQVAHALSTNQVSVEFDYYTAVDDLKPDDTAGADMIGTVEFNSACFYRYANVDVKQLTRNLGDDTELARQSLAAFLRATVEAIPTGKQNSMAAQNPPSFMMTVVREAGLWSLANAFVRPVRLGRDGDLVDLSIRALDSYWDKLNGMYGTEASGVSGVRVATMEGEALTSLRPALTPSVTQTIEGTVSAAFGGGAVA